MSEDTNRTMNTRACGRGKSWMMAVSSRVVTRRAFVRTWALVSGLIAGGSISVRSALGVALLPVYSLDPNCAGTPDVCDHPTGQRVAGSCNVCYACINHAQNKRWASKESITRAHPCCRCSVKTSWVPQGAFDGMFGTGLDFHPEFDQRRM